MERRAEGEAGRSLLPMLVGVLLIPAVLGSSQTIFNDGDVSWHIATGRWMLAHHTIPATDPFSFTWAGKPWVPIEWLSELTLAIAYGLCRYSGVAALVAACLIGLHAVVFANTSRFVRPLLPIVAMDFALVPTLLARPHVLAWPLLALWIWLMLRARERDRAPPLLAALLMTPWANMHGGFVFGLLIAAVFGFEALLATPDRMRVVRQWGLFGLCCAAAVCINGNGIEGVFHPLRFTQLEMLPLIDEWRPSSPATTPFFFGDLAIVLALIVWKRPRLPWVRWLLLGGMLALALLQMRHQALLAVIAVMILPEGFARGEQRHAPVPTNLGWIAAGGAVLLIAVRALLPLTPVENEANPWSLIASVPPELRAQPVLNGYSMGGPLILSGIRPYVDGRGDMYGDRLVVDYANIMNGDAQAFAAAVQRWDIRWAIVPNGARINQLLDRTPGWRRIRHDGVGSIYVRDRVSASGSLPAPR